MFHFPLLFSFRFHHLTAAAPKNVVLPPPPPNPREHFRFPLLPSQPPFLQFRSSIVCEAREKLTKGLVKCKRVVLSRKTIKMKMWNPVLVFFLILSPFLQPRHAAAAFHNNTTLTADSRKKVMPTIEESEIKNGQEVPTAKEIFTHLTRS